MKQILLVDDEAVVRRVLRVALEKAGFAVETASNGEEALTSLRERSPDVLITDIEMPRMDGRTLCETLHAEQPERSFPVFVEAEMWPKGVVPPLWVVVNFTSLSKHGDYRWDTTGDTLNLECSL